MAQPQALSSKEQSLFRTVVKNYESKQYKKGLKSAEQILRKTPNHGDTQAMKALLMNCLGQSEEAFALAKIALKNGMKSHTCWHVYGLLWRSVRNFEEAIKAYKFALKLDPENQTIQRDLALMQAQTRDFQGYIQSRKQMLQARPALRQNWTAMALAHHLAGEFEPAERMLRTYEETLKNPPSKRDIEHSEALLYRNTIIAESGETERALEHLRTISKDVLDRAAVMELRAQYLLDLGKSEEATAAYKALIKRNTEYRAYYVGLEKAMGLDLDNLEGRKQLYAQCAQTYERADAPRRIPLDFLKGDDFRQAVDNYLRRVLRKGVPSAFNNIKSLYTDREKLDIVQSLVEGYAATKSSNGTAQPNGDHKDEFEESTLYFLAQHYNYKLSRNLDKALEITERLMQMSPSTYDYKMTKARIYKHQGDVVAASKTMNEAREMDLRDRYINTKCAKYQLRNFENGLAVQTMSKFTKNDVIGGALGDLHEMQSVWFLTEDGESFTKQGKLGRALKRFHSIFDIFTTWEEDQFDFHSFSLRKGQIRAYLAMVRWEDRLREHPFFARVAIDAVKIYLILYESPQRGQGDCLPYDFASLDDAERKRLLKRAKREHDRVEKENADRKDADKKVVGKKGNVGLDGEIKKSDDDPRGAKFVETKEPLEMAMKFLNPLLEFGENNLEAQHVGFEVYLRRQKYFLALRCLLRAFHLSPSDPTNHHQAIRLLHALQSATGDSVSAVNELAKTSLPDQYGTATTALSKVNDEYYSKHSASLPHACSFVRARQALDTSSLQANEASLVKCLSSISRPEDASLPALLKSIDTAKSLTMSRTTLRSIIEGGSKLWPAAKTLLEREAGIDES